MRIGVEGVPVKNINSKLIVKRGVSLANTTSEDKNLKIKHLF